MSLTHYRAAWTRHTLECWRIGARPMPLKRFVRLCRWIESNGVQA